MFGDRFSAAKSIKNQLINGIQDGMLRLGFILLRKSGPGRSPNAPRRPKIHKEAPNTPPRFLHDAPKTPRRRPKTRPRRLDEAPRRPKTHLRRRKTPQDAPRRFQDPILVGLGTQTGAELVAQEPPNRIQTPRQLFLTKVGGCLKGLGEKIVCPRITQIL